MLLIREVMYCKPGKVRPLVDKFLALARLSEAKGWGKMRVMTDVSAERYWTLVSEMEVPSMEAFMSMGTDDEDGKEFAAIMEGYHDLVESGRREIYTIEGEPEPLPVPGGAPDGPAGPGRISQAAYCSPARVGMQSDRRRETHGRRG